MDSGLVWWLSAIGTQFCDWSDVMVFRASLLVLYDRLKILSTVIRLWDWPKILCLVLLDSSLLLAQILCLV